MADPPPPIAGTEAEWALRGGRSLVEKKWRKSLENMEESGEEEVVSDYSDCPSDGSVDVAAEYEKEMEEQRIADEKNGHFDSNRNRDLASASRFTAPENDAPSIARVPMAAPQSRVSLATHKARALAKGGMNLDNFSSEGGGVERVMEGIAAISKRPDLIIFVIMRGLNWESCMLPKIMGGLWQVVGEIILPYNHPKYLSLKWRYRRKVLKISPKIAAAF